MFEIWLLCQFTKVVKTFLYFDDYIMVFKINWTYKIYTSGFKIFGRLTPFYSKNYQETSKSFYLDGFLWIIILGILGAS